MSAEYDFQFLAAQYELLVVQEDKLHRQNRTCTDAIDTVIQGFIANVNHYDYLAVESLLGALQGVQEHVVMEMARVRIEKGLCAINMAQAKRGQD